MPVDKIRPADLAGLVATLVEDKKARESIRKTLTAVAMVLDFAGVYPNPARDRSMSLPPRAEEPRCLTPTVS